MSRVRFVCLSDFHAGSKYSLLTHLDPVSGKVQPRETSPTLGALSAALKSFMPQVSGEEPPTLILLGDVLDMAFSRLSTTMAVFQRCVEALFPRDGPELFSKRIFFLPGNHDHLLWQPISERLHLASLEARAGRFETKLAPVTGLFDPPVHSSPLLRDLCRSVPHMETADVLVAYPNWGIQGPTSTVVMHHGHFVEQGYRLISAIRDRLIATDQFVTVERLEAENGSWIDFGWSTLGAAGAMGRSVATLHAVLGSDRGSEAFLGRLASLLAGGMCARIPFGSEPKVQNTVAMLTKAALNATLGRSGELERFSYLDVLSAAGLEGLRWYLEEPLYRQLGGALQTPLTFIFGHTHKPFEDEIVAANYAEPVRVFNSGGWVLDEPRLDTVQGASMILIDEHLNVAALRLFGCPVNGVSPPVEVRGTGRFSDVENPLLENVRGALAGTRNQWRAFTDIAATELALRSKAIRHDVERADERATDGQRVL